MPSSRIVPPRKFEFGTQHCVCDLADTDGGAEDMSTQLESAGEQPPRDGADVAASPVAEPSQGGGGGPAGLKGAGGGEAKETLEDFLYVDVDVQDSADKDSSDAGDLGAKGKHERSTTCLLCPTAIAIHSSLCACWRTLR